ncbi:divalent metal cation transporter [Paenibacillus sp.]|uniref:NRAMP family divalent metal transporter n=1 Tax=Paenibacillus sp. TaxID=58172 RepID=UPI00281DB96B|nr:divalent metal cation transporter [Paenibacillus sp.]MDR0269365.1 divalent metal cation transporter [Paenibacillus sp.]
MGELQSGLTSPEGSQLDGNISFKEKMTEGRAGFRKRLWLFWALLGPGIISSLSNNDAGGMISYTMTGVTFGISFFLPLLFLLAPIDYNMQEMSMRLGAVTKTEYRELLQRHFGRFWSYTSVLALVLANLMYIVTEFVGMTAGLTLMGIPLWASDLISFVFVASITCFMGYWSKERLGLFVGAINVVFIIVAFLTHPDPAEIGKVFTHFPSISWDLSSNGVLVFIMATIGNAIAPFMLYYNNNTTLDKGITGKDLRLGRADIAIGALLQPIFAAAVMICGAALFGHVTNLDDSNPADLISAFVPVAGHFGSALFALGLFNAGWLAAITISFSSAYTVAGAFGWKRSQNHKVKEAPKFYGIYLAILLLGAVIILIPGLPLDMMAVFTQIFATMLFVPDLIFLVLLTNNRKLMGEHTNGWWKRLIGWGIIAIYSAVSAVTIYITITGM